MSHTGQATPLAHLRRELRGLRWPRERTSERGVVYRGGADFVLQHGEAFEPRPLPVGLVRGVPGHCYANAIYYAVTLGFPYVEGYALDPDRRIVFQHAWNVDHDGGLVDSTWTGDAAIRVTDDGRVRIYRGKPGAAYLGVRFHPGRADDATWHGDASILDDYRRGWPILRERWPGEDFGREWEPTPPMRAILAGPGPKARAILDEAGRETRRALSESRGGWLWI